MKYLREFPKFLDDLIEWQQMPPPINYVRGMPVPTYESLMQGITTRLQIFALSTTLHHTYKSTCHLNGWHREFFQRLDSHEIQWFGMP